MKLDATNENSSDDEDIFLQGGVPKPISMYTSNLASAPDIISSDDDGDDDDVIVVELATTKRGRGKSAKRGRGSSRVGASRTPPTNVRARKPQKEKTSVFEVSSDDDDDEVVEVTPCETVDDTDPQDATAAASLAQARAVLANQANEEQIAVEAERLAKVESDRAERLREEEKIRREAERKQMEAVKAKAKAAANAKPIQLKVRAGQNSIKMRIRSSDPLIKMLRPFCKKFGLDASKAVMQVEGEDVGEKDTADTHDLEENMIVEIVIRS